MFCRHEIAKLIHQHSSIKILSMASKTVTRSKDIMAGTAVFRGTRVPIQVLMDHLEAGDSIDVFLDGFPSVSREQVIDFLEEAKNRAISAA
jgi:uncharacterized protein (DUF433 family)